MQFKTTAQAAAELGTTRINLNVYLFRHPDLKPKPKINHDDLFWTDDEIAAVREARRAMRRRKS